MRLLAVAATGNMRSGVLCSSRVGAKEIVEMRNEPNVASGRVIIVASPRLGMTSYLSLLLS